MNRGILALTGILVLAACGSRGDEERAAEAEAANAMNSVAATDPHAGHDMTATADSASPHAGHATAAPGAAPPGAAAAHAGHAASTTASPTAASAAHAGHAATAAPARPGATPTPVHDTHAAAAAVSQMGNAPVAAGHHVAEPVAAVRAPEDEAADKLLELGRGLARDSAVRAAIEADPALRERWSDPAVRRALEAQR